jgi:glycosyltransferase 2 family protein
MKITAKLFISFGLIAWFLFSSDCGMIAKSLRGICPTTLVIVIAIYFIAILVNSIKWHQLLPSYTLKTLLSYTFIAQYYTIILPGQMAGEAVKTYKLGKGQKDAEVIAASVVVDKLTGLLGLLFVGIIGLVLSQNNKASSFASIFISLFLILICLLFSLRIKLVDSIFKNILTRITVRFSIFSSSIKQIENLIKAWQDYLHNPGLLILSFFWGVIFQCLAIAIIKILADDMGLFLSFQEWCWIFSAVSIAVLAPLTIGGGTGIREGCFVVILSWFNVSKEKALALSFAILGVMIVGAIMGAFLDWFAIRSNQSG